MGIGQSGDTLSKTPPVFQAFQRLQAIAAITVPGGFLPVISGKSREIQGNPPIMIFMR
jgi:hypothetical protein